MTLDLEPVEVSSLFVNSLSIIREKAATRHIRLSMDGAEDLGSIEVDVRKVKQIVYNLLSNAVKFSAEGGQVSMRVSRVPSTLVGVLSSSWVGRAFPLVDNVFAEFLEVSVADCGIGISPAGLEQLFKPFSQIDSGLARKFEGTGLGLAMVKLLAELHGGSVAVESAVGEGSRFTVWLPLRLTESGPPRPTSSPPRTRSSRAPSDGRTALVVEDDFASAALIRLQLEGEGFRVIQASSAEAALVLAVQQPLALITLDVVLPDMDGWQFLMCIRQLPSLRHTPVVIVSIMANGNKRFSSGASAILQKPISRQELYDTLVELHLFPLEPGRALKVLVVDDDPRAVELSAVRIQGLAGTVLRAYGGREAIESARRELPDLIVLDLMMPDVNGFDVVEALNANPKTANIPILVVTAKEITAEDRVTLHGYVTTILEKTEFDADHFVTEVRRAVTGRALVA